MASEIEKLGRFNLVEGLFLKFWWDPGGGGGNGSSGERGGERKREFLLTDSVEEVEWMFAPTGKRQKSEGEWNTAGKTEKGGGDYGYCNQAPVITAADVRMQYAYRVTSMQDVCGSIFLARFSRRGGNMS
ncbi:hypothetical protein TNCT_356931 [Trichonephila clavata]|uniref:Uncharacterized protein n=1 Tax=Trichonephila clavata TaxID=2740835 RepID=A0A8X6HHP9_TRICU|nr:hypothetical protein TNCT_356931 [Trichonephila clavata]